MHDVSADAEENRLSITLAGKFDDDEATASAEATMAAVEELEPGFDVLTDLREFEPSTDAAKEQLERSKLFLAAHDVGTVVRVVGDSPLANMQFDRTGDEDYEVHTVDSVSEAESILDGQ